MLKFLTKAIIFLGVIVGAITFVYLYDLYQEIKDDIDSVVIVAENIDSIIDVSQNLTNIDTVSAITDDINELTNPTKTETKTEKTETEEVAVVEIEKRRTKKVEIMEPMNTDFPIYNEPKRRR